MTLMTRVNVHWYAKSHVEFIPTSSVMSLRGGWKCGYITCAILRRSRVWYDWNVNNVPCLACRHMFDEILRWLEVFYYTTAGGDHKAIIPTYQYLISEIYT